MKVIFVLFTLFISLSTLACRNINFYETHPVINDLPIINQGFLNACYAHTLATVYNLDVAADSEKRLNPFWIAFIHKKQGLHWQPRKLDYSLLSMAWGDLKKNGFCDISLIEKRLTELKRGVPYSDSQLLFLLSKYFQVKTRETRTEMGHNVIVLRLYPKLVSEGRGLFEVPWKMEDIHAILRPIRDQAARMSFFDWMNTYVFKACRERAMYFPKETLVSLGRTNEKNFELAQVIEELLARQKSVSVGYCYRIIKDPELDFNVQPRFLKVARVNCGAHYSTLVGSKKVGESCQYLLRNSYGRGFWGDKSYTCYCKDHSTGENRDCLKTEKNPYLEVLGCWVDSDKLLTNTFDLSYFRE